MTNRIAPVFALLLSLAAAPLAAQTAPSDDLSAILKDLAAYSFDQGVGAPLRLRAYVFAAKDDPARRAACETALDAFIASKPAPGGLMAACRSLRLIGTAASVPALAALLLDPAATDPARYALERIPGPEPDQALLAALEKATGDVRLGIIGTLGDRSSDPAVPALAALARSTVDRATVTAAVRALGRISTDESAAALLAALAAGPEPVRLEAAAGLVRRGDDLIKIGDPRRADPLYAAVLSSAVPASIRGAAWLGRVAGAGDRARAMIQDAITGRDAALREPAIAAVPRYFRPAELAVLFPLMSRLSEPDQARLIAVFSRYPGDAVLPAVLRAAESRSAAVRLEALRALETVGNGTLVEFLAHRAAITAGEEQARARETLDRVRGADVDAAVLALLGTSKDADLRAELARAVGQRRIAAGKPALMAEAASAEPAVRTQAIRALREIAASSDVVPLLSMTFKAADDDARRELQDTAAAAARSNPRLQARSAEVKAMLRDERDPRREADLLAVAGKIGDDSALPLVRSALESPDASVVDAAVRSLADWRTPGARDDLIRIARTTPDATLKVLALRGFIRLVGQERYRAPEAAVADLSAAIAAAERKEEKVLALGALPSFPCPEALRAAQAAAADPSIAAEAGLAAQKIGQVLEARRKADKR